MLGAPLDVLVTAPLDLPDATDARVGAVCERAPAMFDGGAAQVHLSAEQRGTIEDRARAEVERRVERYRGGRPLPDLTGRTVLVVDDGLASGTTARAAVAAVRAHGARRVVVAVPVTPVSVLAELLSVADDVVCVTAPATLGSIGRWYDEFPTVTDDDVVDVLSTAPVATDEQRVDRTTVSRSVDVVVDDVEYPATLAIPERSSGVVVIGHLGDNSGRAVQTETIAARLHDDRLATLCVDLLAAGEAHDRQVAADVALLGDRLAGAVHWVTSLPEVRGLPVGCFGAGPVAPAALLAAVGARETVDAVVSCSGRPDLAGDRLPDVRAPVLLIVGGRDHVAVTLHRRAGEQLGGQSQVVVMPGSCYRLRNAEVVDAVSREASQWFRHHLAAAAASTAS
jgi:putative phosphoribosyl transferase